jgi:hypothetical protein
MTHKATLDCFGDTLEIVWDGNVWVSPVNSQQHGSRRDAMKTELEFYFRSSGDDPDDPESAAHIVGLLENIEE